MTCVTHRIQRGPLLSWQVDEAAVEMLTTELKLTWSDECVCVGKVMSY